MAKKLTKQQDIAATKDYVKFLEKALASKNYKNRVSEDEFLKQKAKLDKAKFKLKMLGVK